MPLSPLAPAQTPGRRLGWAVIVALTVLPRRRHDRRWAVRTLHAAARDWSDFGQRRADFRGEHRHPRSRAFRPAHVGGETWSVHITEREQWRLWYVGPSEEGPTGLWSIGSTRSWRSDSRRCLARTVLEQRFWDRVRYFDLVAPAGLPDECGAHHGAHHA